MPKRMASTSAWQWDEEDFENESNESSKSSVWYAAWYGEATDLRDILQRLNQTERTDAVEHLKSIQIREDICARFFGGTPLIAAARRGKLDRVKELLRYNANIEAEGENVAEDINNWEIDGTAYYRTPVDDQNGTALFAAASEEYLDVVSCLIENGANVNARSNKQSTGAPNDNFRENICSEDDLRSRIFGTFVVKFLACLPLLGFSNI